MADKILYNGVDVFSGVSPTPFVSWGQENIEYGSRWGATTSLSLLGQITGRCDDYNDLINKQNRLLSGFSQDFHSLSIIEDNTTMISHTLLFVELILNSLIMWELSLSLLILTCMTKIIGVATMVF